MHLRTVTAISTFVLAALASPLQGSIDEVELKERADCPSVIVYGVRGSSDNPTLNSDPNIYNQLPPEFGQIASAIGGRLQAIAYPASSPQVNNGANYGPSVQKGIESLQDTIYAFINQCPTVGKIVVLGYSQGAQVVSGALAGSRYRGPLKAKGRGNGPAITYVQSQDISN